jgi:hypothetical protein
MLINIPTIFLKHNLRILLKSEGLFVTRPRISGSVTIMSKNDFNASIIFTFVLTIEFVFSRTQRTGFIRILTQWFLFAYALTKWHWADACASRNRGVRHLRFRYQHTKVRSHLSHGELMFRKIIVITSRLRRKHKRRFAPVSLWIARNNYNSYKNLYGVIS